MAYALVGTIGNAVLSTAGTAATPTFGTGESRTAGNLLICFCSVTGSNTIPTTPSGWSVAVQFAGGTTTYAEIFYKIAAGADAAPTIAAITNGLIAAQLAEFSGNAATPLDKTGANSSTSSPLTATLNAADTASGELLLVTGADFRSVARSPNDTWTSNNATITQAGNNNAVSSVNHYSFGYSLATTSNASADTAVMTLSVTTSITAVTVAAATFKLVPPAGPSTQQKASFFSVL
jgi:hypothetical protein